LLRVHDGAPLQWIDGKISADRFFSTLNRGGLRYRNLLLRIVEVE